MVSYSVLVKLLLCRNCIPRLGGVGILVYKKHARNFVDVKNISLRLMYLILKITQKYSLKIIQAYAPTTGHMGDEMENFYEDITTVL